MIILNDTVQDEGDSAVRTGGGRHRKQPVPGADRPTWAERAVVREAVRAQRRALPAAAVRHRRQKRSVLIATGTPVLVMGAVAAAATTGTLHLSAAPASGAGDLSLS